MTAPNRATLWGRTLVDELAKSGVTAAVVSPGSRSTPLTVALAEHDDIETYSVLDERSAAFFALGRGRRTGEPTAVVCTSGTAAANYHPAVIEANQSRVPLLVLTADRPAELTDSGANQTVDQAKLYGDAVRWYKTLPEPAPEARRLRSLRVAADRAVAETTGSDPGPVHLNFPVAKPLEPTETPGDVPDSLADEAPLAVDGRDGPFVRTTSGRLEPNDAAMDEIAAALGSAERGLIVAGPLNPGVTDPEVVGELLDATGVPLLADPLSGLRHGPLVADRPVFGGYDSYLDAAGWPDPDIALRIGASPTSKVLRRYLAEADARQVVVDPAGDWPEAEFTATDYVEADPGAAVSALAERVEDRSPADGDRGGDASAAAWRTRFERAEAAHWNLLDEATESATAGTPFEGAVLSEVVTGAPDPATVFVSNSMPVRDCDRFGRPRRADLTVLGNRGASGIDGITSTALGAGSATEGPLVLVTGDLAYYHDANGLLSVARCGVDATIVLINNDGGGIFHILPIEAFDPPFTEQFVTPHGLDFEHSADMYDLSFRRATDIDDFAGAYRESLTSEGTQVIEIRTDGEASHRRRERLHERVCERVAEDR
ncbi:2-succinyl-6-hydroxy-2,4-cyclohexadiene-1-carboxylate synthase [Halosimplex carlsbadense 2-9-1]|uniref:2-succinyl-5-enolpyruvyl-6-hydroxy-3-cyclohexene-1-carboxylate synthase n=1 Tax=Halosimplex carlsbadense 2-9-1 TaxID=797114 RepID=M0CNX8_9EURY|nr:2-succinyl-5-enolpyruvyl-6-hydroxy-3-cyclohexene-1-carboxylic-acid synthase [Halosimplex carlsbadense]ELZ24348.1 2-succinyl-6-hydroxy-2,4-cyclohexadiene-1-carboxylate synthase [Halosimplex carlsbadense 2-9-1]